MFAGSFVISKQSAFCLIFEANMKTVLQGKVYNLEYRLDYNSK